ncbi:putative ArsR family transcriptional regulator [Virgibacillus natechei]|uniref:ArsR family transcriptional regulator n=1 Tax=Virgibacillus natechei TaxID=1216297 RepID=A0ABS4ILH5_9BACI|nr:helix-turn-helix domain-containing protein [Virgibacillus natechei]MBP1971760.1 putative ArsR family transcriptional regulator [Virgibacillus natechei]UZD11466.1 helix-turn-helix domain-containing protein [Virgibacillus natechei]
MENTLKVTNVLSDPTRYSIYQYIIQHHKEVNVLEISEKFDIHPNVARLHLSKLEDINMIVSYSQKTGKGGRPSRLYRLSNEVVELNFPHRDYKLLSSIAIESFVELGEPGRQALYKTGNKYGKKVIEHYNKTSTTKELTMDRKINILEDAGKMLGMYPLFEHSPESNSIAFEINNCPFKEIASDNNKMVCNMHHSFLKGMFESLFSDVDLIEGDNILQGCESCTYVAKLSIV